MFLAFHLQWASSSSFEITTEAGHGDETTCMPTSTLPSPSLQPRPAKTQALNVFWVPKKKKKKPNQQVQAMHYRDANRGSTTCGEQHKNASHGHVHVLL
jgi:hypothetical protein